MGEIIIRKVKGMSWKSKISLVLIFTMVFSTFMYQGWYKPKKAEAVITIQSGWAQQYAAVAYPAGAVNANYTIAAGTNRLLVVAIASTRTTVGTQTVSSVTYGGQALTLAAGDAASAVTTNHTYLYYLKESGIQAASGTSLNVTITGGTQYYTYVYAAVFAGVDQTTPLTDAQNYNSNQTATTAIGPFASGLNVAAGDQAVEIVNLARSANGTTARTVTAWSNATWPAPSTVAATYNAVNGPCVGLHINNRNVTTAATETSQHTASNAASYKSMTGLSMKVFTCTDSDPATLTISDPTSSSTITGTKTVRVTVGGGEPAANMTGMVVNIAGAGACNVTNGAMTLNAGVWEYSWNTSACGTSTVVTGVTIDASGTDPDCGGSLKNASQVTNITIDNTDPSKIKSCGGCHAYPPTDGAARNNPAGAVVGSHSAHSGNVCATCHVAPATETSADFGHRNGTIQMQATISGGSYSRGTSFAQSNSSTTGTCSTNNCHGGVTTPQWGVGTVACITCHSNAMNANDGAPTRRAVFGEFANNAVGHMQYNVSATANATVKADCTKCHAEPTASHVNNTLDNGRAGAPGGATIGQPPAAAFCLDCHKSGATNNSFSTQSRTAPDIDGSGWTTGTTAKSGTGLVLGMQSHRAAVTDCTDCHGDGAGNARVHGGGVNNLMKQATQYQTCFNGTSTACHGSSSTIANTGARIELAASATGGIHPIFGAAVPLANIKNALMRTRTTLGTTTTTDGHDDMFIRGWSATSTMVCSDCHSQDGASGVRGPHGSAYGYILKGLDNTAVTTATSGRTLGSPYVSGVLTVTVNNQENICLNCHAADIYGDGKGVAAANYAIDTAGHTQAWTNAGTSRCGASSFQDTASGGTKSARINCLNCHAGSNPAGGYGAHGSTRAVSTAGQIFSSPYTTQGTGFINGDSWTAAPDATNGCYATTAATNWSACTQGTHN